VNRLTLEELNDICKVLNEKDPYLKDLLLEYINDNIRTFFEIKNEVSTWDSIDRDFIMDKLNSNNITID